MKRPEEKKKIMYKKVPAKNVIEHKTKKDRQPPELKLEDIPNYQEKLDNLKKVQDGDAFYSKMMEKYGVSPEMLVLQKELEKNKMQEMKRNPKKFAS